MQCNEAPPQGDQSGAVDKHLPRFAAVAATSAGWLRAGRYARPATRLGTRIAGGGGMRLVRLQDRARPAMVDEITPETGQWAAVGTGFPALDRKTGRKPATSSRAHAPARRVFLAGKMKKIASRDEAPKEAAC